MLVERADFYRIEASRLLDGEAKSALGQFMTPAPTAQFMASLFGTPITSRVRLLDAGAGIGSLSAAFVAELCGRQEKPAILDIVTYEVDRRLADYLDRVLGDCHAAASSEGVEFHSSVFREDFIRACANLPLADSLFDTSRRGRFTHAILNPPYGKIRSNSEHRLLLRTMGIETSNLYTGFLAIAIQLLEKNGEMVAITPRSFCNGPYFRPFRKLFLKHMTLRKIHVFETRNQTFSDDKVLQENIIFHAVKDKRRDHVVISASSGPDFSEMTVRGTHYNDVVKPDDPGQVLHIATNHLDQHVVDRVSVFQTSLNDIGMDVSTGCVVDFRAKEHLRDSPERGTVPLIYPGHFQDGYVRWPKMEGKKPNAIVHNKETGDLLLPAGYYVVVKRFTAKEEPRRIVSAVYDPRRISAPVVAFENHINVYHTNNGPLTAALAKGLAVFLQSSLLDIYFRQFSGHTQVNATDLRTLTYPSRQVLERIGNRIGEVFPNQNEVDRLMEEEIQKMAKIKTPDPVSAKRKINEALSILKLLGFPRGQQNDRSALTLLALLGLTPKRKWAKASSPLMGITPIMEFVEKYYGHEYAPNTRETFRRQTVHQFVAAALAVQNPDEPDRPINSPKYCYQIEPAALQLIQTYGTKAWDSLQKEYLGNIKTLKSKYARERQMQMIPVTIADGSEIQLTPGDHNYLIKNIIEVFAPRFAPDGTLLYVGDTGNKWGYCNEDALKDLVGEIDPHGKMPDVVIYHNEKGWLLLIEAVTSHGPVDSKRHEELAKLFESSSAGLLYVTTFPTRSDMARYLSDISWETEVWVADAPTHLIHFNGVRFLGPYDR